MAVRGTALAAAAVGGVFAYGGITGKSPLAAVQAIVQGQSPATVAQTQGITPATAGTVAGNTSDVVARAASQIGKPYILDSPTNPAEPDPKGFDCSGLVMWSYAPSGIILPHNTISMWNAKTLQHVPLASAPPGALIFFGIMGAPHHVAVYAGNGEIIEAPDFGIPVRRNSMNAYHDLDKVAAFPAEMAGSATTADRIQSGNPQSIAKLLLPSYGWSGADQWTALDELWSRESSWSPTATGQPTSQGRAYGIPQALPESKLPKAGRSPQNGGTSDPQTQIRWGLSYIRSRYGSPVAAWAHETSAGWY